MNKLLIVSLFACVSCFAQAPASAQKPSGFKKDNFNYNEWTKGKLSEVVTITPRSAFANHGDRDKSNHRATEVRAYVRRVRVRLARLCACAALWTPCPLW